MSSWWAERLGFAPGVLFLILVLSPLPLQAEIVEAEGVGTILTGDVAQARDEAIIDARVRALEKAVGVLVDAETLVQNELLLSATVRNTSSGMITDYQVVSEGAEGDLYRLKISAKVEKAELEEQIKTNLTSNLTVIIQIDEEMAGEPIDDSLIENELVEGFIDAGYDVRDREHVEMVRQRDSEITRIEGDVEQAQMIGLRFLSNLVIKGTAKTSVHANKSEYAPSISIPSAHARVTCRMVEVETGKIIGQEQVRRIKDFGQDEFDASEKAMEKAAPEIVKKVLSWMNSEYLVNKMKTVRVEAKGLPSLASYRRLLNLVSKLRWVEAVEAGEFKDGSGAIELRYPEKLVYLATRIDRDPGFRLTTMDERKIIVTACDR